MTYKYNKNTLQFETISSKAYIWQLLGICLIMVSLGFTTAIQLHHYEIIPVVYRTHESVFNKEEFKQEIFNSHCKFPNIVWKQALIESGNFTSPLFKQANNPFGMRVSQNRATLCSGDFSNFARYRTLHEALGDYLLWQVSYCQDIETEEEYIQFLDKVYCPAQGYAIKLNQIQ